MADDAAPRPPKAPGRKATGAKKAAATAAPAAPRRPGRPPKIDKLRESLVQTYVGIAVGAGALGGALGLAETERVAVSMAIMENAQSCADAWCQLAETNPKVLAALEKFTEAGGWGTVVTAHVSVGLSIYGAIAAGRATAQAEAIADDEPPFTGPARVAPDGN